MEMCTNQGPKYKKDCFWVWDVIMLEIWWELSKIHGFWTKKWTILGPWYQHGRESPRWTACSWFSKNLDPVHGIRGLDNLHALRNCWPGLSNLVRMFFRLNRCQQTFVTENAMTVQSAIAKLQTLSTSTFGASLEAYSEAACNIDFFRSSTSDLSWSASGISKCKNYEYVAWKNVLVPQFVRVSKTCQP